MRDAVRLGVMYLGGCVLDPAGQAKCWGSPFGADSAARAMDLPWSSIDVSGGQNGAVFLAPDGGVHELTGG